MPKGHLELLRGVVAALEHQEHRPGPVTQSHLDRFVRAKIAPNGTYGITADAAVELYELADSIFSQSKDFSERATFSQIFDVVADGVIEVFFDRRDREVEQADVPLLKERIRLWFTKNATTNQAFVPCLLAPRYAPPFAVGPVQFVHVKDFPARYFPAQEQEDNFALKKTIESMHREGSFWFAAVDVNNCTRERAKEVADLAVDLALCALQLVIPLEDSRTMARLTARSLPRFAHSISVSAGQIHWARTNQEAGFSLGPGTLEHHLGLGRDVIDAVGPLVSAYIDGGSRVPTLALAWADAGYWFHEGLAEPLDTIAVPKIETALENLMRSESSARCETRLRRAIKVFYGLEYDQPLHGGTEITVKQYVTRLVRDRSRILHGTDSTLRRAMHATRSGITQFARDLLSKFALHLKRYAATGGATDDLDAFLDDVEQRRRSDKAGPF